MSDEEIAANAAAMIADGPPSAEMVETFQASLPLDDDGKPIPVGPAAAARRRLASLQAS